MRPHVVVWHPTGAHCATPAHAQSEAVTRKRKEKQRREESQVSVQVEGARGQPYDGDACQCHSTVPHHRVSSRRPCTGQRVETDLLLNALRTSR